MKKLVGAWLEIMLVDPVDEELRVLVVVDCVNVNVENIIGVLRVVLDAVVVVAVVVVEVEAVVVGVVVVKVVVLKVVVVEIVVVILGVVELVPVVIKV